MPFPYKAAPVRVALANVHVVWYSPRSDGSLSFEDSYHRLTWHAKWAQRWLRERWWMSSEYGWKGDLLECEGADYAQCLE